MTSLNLFGHELVVDNFAGGGLDGAWIQERATELDLLEETTFDPEIHTTDCEGIEPGERFYVEPDWLVEAARAEGDES